MSFKIHSMKRSYFELVQEYLKIFPCVAILGPRQCGKTTLLKTLNSSWTIFDLEKGSDYDIISRDPDLFFRLNERFIAIDEAQILPSVFSALRVAIDDDRDRRGRFVITGSSSPSLVKSISETLAGRIGIIEMAPLSFSETHQVFCSPFFDALESGANLVDIVGSLCATGDIQSVHQYWFQGGYPEPWLRDSGRFKNLWMDNYVKTYLERDLGSLFPGVNSIRFRQFLGLLANVSGSIINYSEVARSLAVSQPTVRDYFDIAHGSFIWRKIPSFHRNSLKRLSRHPKGFYRDSGLLHHLLRLPDLSALLSHPKMGSSWESMVIEQIIRGLHSRGVPFDFFYYRTTGGAEVDLIIEGNFGLIPIEIKYRQTVPGRELRSIQNFMVEYNTPFGLVINNDERPRLYNEKLIGIPFQFL